MAKAHSNGLMVLSMLVIGSITKHMVKVHFIMLMAMFTKACGEMERQMVGRRWCHCHCVYLWCWYLFCPKVQGGQGHHVRVSEIIRMRERSWPHTTSMECSDMTRDAASRS